MKRSVWGRQSLRSILAVSVTAALGVVGIQTAANAGGSVSAPIAQGLAGPLQFAVANNGDVYIGQAFSGALSRIDSHGAQTDVFVGAEGVDVKGEGSVTFTSTMRDANDTTIGAALNRMNRKGEVRQLADTLAYENDRNPDADNVYGFQGLTSECAAQVPPEVGGGDPYHGLLDSHPYSVAIGRGGERFVADAGGNDVLVVNERGRIRTVAVLPAVPVVISAGAAVANGLPACVVGKTYNFEPVPTDVEVGPDGMLYVSSLPGGPEDGSLGPLGSVYRINPSTGKMRRIASGLAGATNVAVAPNGTVYVAELYGQQVSKIVDGHAVAVVSLPDPAGVEFSHGKLYVSYDVFANGTVATVEL